MNNITISEPLTKENLWNKLQEKYPQAMKEFCEFVDKYKEKIGWAELFGAIIRPDWTHIAPKFHDLPFGLQFGIWMEFQSNRSSNPYIRLGIRDALVGDIVLQLETAEQEINSK